MNTNGWFLVKELYRLYNKTEVDFDINRWFKFLIEVNKINRYEESEALRNDFFNAFRKLL